MHATLDMTNLRTMIDNDSAIECELIHAFHACYAASLRDLENGLTQHDNVQWYNGAHAIKGIAVNIGAYRLGDLCLHAEQASDEKNSVKQSMLDAIQQNYLEVCQALQNAALRN